MTEPRTTPTPPCRSSELEEAKALAKSLDFEIVRNGEWFTKDHKKRNEDSK
jgi:hypothetical protein